MKKFYLGSLSLVLAIGLTQTARAEEAVEMAVGSNTVDVDTAAVPAFGTEAVLKKIAELDKLDQEEAAAAGEETKEKKSLASQVKGFVEKVQTATDLNGAIKKMSPTEARLTILPAFMFAVGTCSEVLGNDVGECVKHQGFYQGFKIVQRNIGLKRLTRNKITGDTRGAKVLRFVVGKVDDGIFNFARGTLESRAGVEINNSLLEKFVESRLDGGLRATIEASKLGLLSTP